MSFNLGNALKYIWRCDEKLDAIEDLKKAKWYIDRELKKRDLKPVEAPTKPPKAEETYPLRMSIERLARGYMSTLDYLPQGESVWVPEDVYHSIYWDEPSYSHPNFALLLDEKMIKFTRLNK